MRPAVSLYVPCYNGALWLAECLDALLAQTRPADEVLVVDDGSTDDTAAVANRYAGRVRLVAHAANRGLAVARNTALAASRGEIVASVDADVRVTPTWLERLLTAFTSPRVVAAGGRLEEANRQRLADAWRAAHMAQHAGGFPLRNPPVLPGANVAVRPDVVRALGGYDESFRTNYEDADLQHRLQAAGYLCRYEPGALAYHLRRDDASSVLRTYWGWLRPPLERQGAFRDENGLSAKAAANAAFARRALWLDLSSGQGRLAYLSLLVLLAFPAADLAHAHRRAVERGDAAGAGALAGLAAGWVARAPDAVSGRSAAIAARLTGDLGRLAWWHPADPAAAGDPQRGRGQSGTIDLLLAETQAAVESLPRAWWPDIEAARSALAAEEGWSSAGADPRDAGGAGPGAADAPPLARWGPLAAWLAAATGRECQAVLLHGADGRGERLPWAPVELLVVGREGLPAARLQALQDAVAAQQPALVAGRPVRLRSIPGHRLGWLPASPLQQSLLAGAVVLWAASAAAGAAVLGAVPRLHPSRIDPREAQDEVAAAGADLAAGRARLAVARAGGALLIARRAYTPWHSRLAGALQTTWPEAPEPGETTAERYVDLARRLIADWLFTWEQSGPGGPAVARYGALRAGARAAGETAVAR